MKKAILALLAVSAIFGSRAEEPTRDANWKKLAALRSPKPEGTKVISGNELEIAGIRCRLFGIQIRSQHKEAAKRFLELYMKDYGNYFSIYNDNAPINDKDGVPLIWLQGSGNGGWAQETLVQAGLATVSYTGFDNYKFTVPMKSDVNEFDWRACLKKAEADLKTGAKPHVNFKWPDPK